MTIQRFKSLMKAALVLGSLSAILVSDVFGQASPPQIAGHAASDQSKPVSLPHLYWHFLIYQHQLDQLAIEHERQGKDGAWLHSYLQTKLAMSDAEFQPIRESANRLNSGITDLNAKAKPLMFAAQAARSKGGATVPDAQDYRAKLTEMTGQREALINKEIEALNEALGPEMARRLQNYVQNTFSKSVSMVHMTPGQGKGQPSGTTTNTNKVQP